MELHGVGTSRHSPFEYLTVFVVLGCFIGSFGDELNCPLLTNATRLKIVSRKNHTPKKFCGASLETICFKDPVSDACQSLVNLSVSVVAEGDQVVELGLTLLATLESIGKREEILCNLTDLAKDFHFSDNLFTVNCWLDYDCCCCKGKSKATYFSRLSIFYYELDPCEATATIRLISESNEIDSPVDVTVSRGNNSATAESFVMLDRELSRTGLLASVIMAVLGAVVTVIVIYIVCVKRGGDRCSKQPANSCQSQWTPLPLEMQEDCRHCNFDIVEVVPPEEDSVGCSTLEIDIIPPVISSSSDEELPDDKFDSGWYE